MRENTVHKGKHYLPNNVPTWGKDYFCDLTMYLEVHWADLGGRSQHTKMKTRWCSWGDNGVDEAGGEDGVAGGPGNLPPLWDIHPGEGGNERGGTLWYAARCWIGGMCCASCRAIRKSHPHHTLLPNRGIAIVDEHRCNAAVVGF